MADKVPSVTATATSTTAATIKKLSENSAATAYSSSILCLAANYNKLNQQCTKTKPPDILEDYNNNNIDKACALFAASRINNNDHSDTETTKYDNFISGDATTGLSAGSAKWVSLRSDSPFLSSMISPPPRSQAPLMSKSMCPSGITSNTAGPGNVTPLHHQHNQQSIMTSQLIGNSISGGCGSTTSASIMHKCANSANSNSSSSTNGAMAIKKGENCMTHAMPNTLWCLKCHTLICRACAGSDDHRNHNVKTQAKEVLRTEIATELLSMQKSLIEAQHLVLKQRDFLLKLLESCSNLKSHIESELVNHAPTLEVAELRDSFCRAKLCLNVLDQVANGQPPTNASNTPTAPTPIELFKLYTTLSAEKQRLLHKHQELYFQCKLNDLLRSAGTVIDFESISKPLQALALSNDSGAALSSGPLLLVTNYCLTQIYARHSPKPLNSISENTSNGAPIPQLQPTLFGDSANSTTDPFLFANHLSGSASSAANLVSSHSPANYVPQMSSSSSYCGTKSPFLDLAVGSTGTLMNSSSGAPPMQHALHFSHSATSAPSNPASSQSFGHFGDNLLMSNAFQQSLGSASTQHGIASPLSTIRHGAGGGGGAGGISFEMNGISVPITMISSQKFPSNIQAGGMHQQAHHHHHHVNSHPHHNHQLLHSTNISSSSSNSSGSNSIICNPTVHIYPIFYFNIEINGQPFGRILIEVRNDVAPRMAKNFAALASGELGFGYKGCQIFQCWENESIITGDFELNNGRGGRSVFEEGFFMPDDTKILAIRGSVGMRRSQKRHDNMGLVGSQFRIILREMRGFTGIFAFVIEGLELVEKISQTGDSAGKPQSNVLIVSCGKLQ